MTTAEMEVCSCAALRQATRHVSQFYDAALAPVGLGLNQYSILSKIVRSGPITVQNLAVRLVMDRSTLGHLLRPLEGRGLVTLQRSQQDRRSRLIALTPDGSTLYAQARPLWIDAERHFAARFGEKASRDLQTILRQVTATDLHAL